MRQLEELLALENIEAIEAAIYEQEVSVVVDWRGEDDDIVACFSKRIGGKLSREWTPNQDLQIGYNDAKMLVGLKVEIADRDRTLRAIRDILCDDYEIRVLKSCLDADTFEFVVETHEKWRQLDEKYANLTAVLFVPFTDAVKFGA